jgi:HKD family nuclease
VPDVTAISQPDGKPLGEALIEALENPDWTHLQGAVAFVRASGVKCIGKSIESFAVRNSGQMRIAVGIDEQGSSLEAVQGLWQLIAAHGGRVFIVRNPRYPSPTFHPKGWHFSNSTRSLTIVGSGNLTRGGLYTNYEMGIAVEAGHDDGTQFHADINSLLADWTDPTKADVIEVTAEVLAELNSCGALPGEQAMRATRGGERRIRKVIVGLTSSVSSLFRGRIISAPPPPQIENVPEGPVVAKPPVRIPASAQGAAEGAATTTTGETGPASAGPLPSHDALFIEVNVRDKTEVHLAKAALDDDPSFFGAPFSGRTESRSSSGPTFPEAEPRPLVDIRVFDGSGAVTHQLNGYPLKFWFYDTKKELRIHFEASAIAAIADGSILVMERNPSDAPGIDYSLQFLPPGHPSYAAAKDACTIPLPGGQRSYGWR